MTRPLRIPQILLIWCLPSGFTEVHYMAKNIWLPEHHYIMSLPQTVATDCLGFLSLYAVALQFSFSGMNGLSPDPRAQNMCSIMTIRLYIK